MKAQKRWTSERPTKEAANSCCNNASECWEQSRRSARAKHLANLPSWSDAVCVFTSSSQTIRRKPTTKVHFYFRSIFKNPTLLIDNAPYWGLKLAIKVWKWERDRHTKNVPTFELRSGDALKKLPQDFGTYHIWLDYLSQHGRSVNPRGRLQLAQGVNYQPVSHSLSIKNLMKG